jgi:hypothetical protein
MKPTSLLNAFLPLLLGVATYAATETTNQLGGITRILDQKDITAGLATTCPTGLEAQISYFDSTAMYAWSAPLEKMNEDVDRSNLVAVARFIGEMRSLSRCGRTEQCGPGDKMCRVTAPTIQAYWEREVVSRTSVQTGQVPQFKS